MGLLASVVLAAGFFLYQSPSDATSRREAAGFAAQGRWDRVVESLQRIRSATPDDRLLAASAHLALKDYDRAAADLSRMPSDGPTAARRLLLLGQIEQARYRSRPMEAALREAIRIDPGLVPARRLLVYLCGLQDRRSEVREQFAALAELVPPTTDLILHWGLSHGMVVKPSEAEAALVRFIEGDPEDRLSRLALAEIQYRAGRWEESIRTIASLPEDDPRAIAIRAQVDFSRGQRDEALERLATGPKDDLAILKARGRLALANGDPRQAVAALRMADAKEPDDFETVFVLVRALRQSGEIRGAGGLDKRAESLQLLQTWLNDLSKGGNVDEPSVLHKIAALCEAVGFDREAAAWYRLVISRAPLDREAQAGLYRLKNKLGDGRRTVEDGAKED